MNNDAKQYHCPVTPLKINKQKQECVKGLTNNTLHNAARMMEHVNLKDTISNHKMRNLESPLPAGRLNFARSQQESRNLDML